MVRVGQRGFTVIELILFLAVSGALMTGLLFGVNANISQQRYQDSARSLQGLFQQQYFDVQNTTNERSEEWRCGETGIEATDRDNGQARGTTNCLLLGRYVQIKPGGTELELGAVVGRAPTEDLAGGDIATLVQHNPRLSPVGVEKVDVDWQSRLYVYGGDTVGASVVFLRSPASGVVRTFVGTGELPVAIGSILTPAAATNELVQCIESGSQILGPTWSLTVRANVSSPTGVTLNQNDERC